MHLRREICSRMSNRSVCGKWSVSLEEHSHFNMGLAPKGNLTDLWDKAKWQLYHLFNLGALETCLQVL